ncbi:porin [Paraburkholderia aspalathi]|uniref:porin n=1 Tax=Paraburkholderia aspalathi TaxID=1324617 RepID=UPI000B8A5F54
MKKILHYGGLSLGLIACSSVSHAQSSVTLYGILASGFVYTNNAGGHSNIQQASGLPTSNRWGLRGTEDLGNGLSTVFVLESGFDLSTGKLGQNGRLFGRKAYVGLSDARLGTLTLGRQYQTTNDYLAPLALTGTFAGGSLAAHPYDNDDLNGSIKSNNAVKFQSANYGGFQYGGMYGFSNAAGSFADSRVYSFSASYVTGGLTVASTYMHLNNGGSATNPNGAVATGDSTFYASRQDTWGAGANYTFGAATVGLLFSQTQLGNATAIGSYAAGTSSNVKLTNPSARFTNYEFNGRYQPAANWTLSAAYTFTDARLDGEHPKYQQLTVQTAYLLSKRTDLFAAAAYQHVGSTGKSGITAHLVGLSSSSTNSQVGVEIGIRHRF